MPALPTEKGQYAAGLNEDVGTFQLATVGIVIGNVCAALPWCRGGTHKAAAQTVQAVVTIVVGGHVVLDSHTGSIVNVRITEATADAGSIVIGDVQGAVRHLQRAIMIANAGFIGIPSDLQWMSLPRPAVLPRALIVELMNSPLP